MTEDEYVALHDLTLLRVVMRELGSVSHNADIQGAARFIQSEIDRLERVVEQAMDPDTGSKPE